MLLKKLEELMEPKKSNQIELHINEVNKKGLEIKVGQSTYQLPDFEGYSKKFLEVLQSFKKRYIMI